jgi:hypothetical protein
MYREVLDPRSHRPSGHILATMVKQLVWSRSFETRTESRQASEALVEATPAGDLRIGSDHVEEREQPSVFGKRVIMGLGCSAQRYSTECTRRNMIIKKGLCVRAPSWRNMTPPRAQRAGLLALRQIGRKGDGSFRPSQRKPAKCKSFKRPGIKNLSRDIE